MLRDAVRRVLQLVALWLAKVTANRSEMNGITVLDAPLGPADNEQDHAEALSKLREALALIRAADPRRYSRIARDVRRIMIFSAGGPEYVSSIRAIVLNGPHIVRRSRARLAMDIIHEGCHAHIAQRGIRFGRHNAARIEHRCVKEESCSRAVCQTPTNL